MRDPALEREIEKPSNHTLDTLLRRILAILALIFTFVAVLAGESHAEEATSVVAASDLAILMEHFAGNGIVSADFEETRHISLLSDAIETAGVLYFAPPDRLARQTTRPGDSRIVVHGTRVAFRDETGTRRVDLASSDIALSLTNNLMVLLRGDLPALRERYEIAFSSDGRSWRLDLEPRHETVRRIIEGIRFLGNGPELEVMETRETNGDTSVVIFKRVETQLELSRDEFDRIFSLEPVGSGDTSSSQGPATSPQPPPHPRADTNP